MRFFNFARLNEKLVIPKKPPAIELRERANKIRDRLIAEYPDGPIPAERIRQAIENLPFLVLMCDGTLSEHSRNDAKADMLVEMYFVLNYFAENHKQYVCPLPKLKTADEKRNVE